MTNTIAHQEIEGEQLSTLQAVEAVADAMVYRGNLHKGGLKSWIGEVIGRWDEWVLAQGKAFRVDESVREQHSLASLPPDNWRVPYGMDNPDERELVAEIERRRKEGISLEGLEWPPSDDPYAPANNPNHPLYLPHDDKSSQLTEVEPYSYSKNDPLSCPFLFAETHGYPRTF
jgi:hypothetical protein